LAVFQCFRPPHDRFSRVGRTNIDDLITHVLPFELMRRGESIRSVVTY
jgi:hypothetical protein